MRTGNSAEGTSLFLTLLWPYGRSAIKIPEQSWIDLRMGDVAAALTLDRQRARMIEGVLRHVPAHAPTVQYRLDITNDFLENEALGNCLESLIPVIEKLRSCVFRPDRFDWSPIQEVTWRIRELEHYVQFLDILADAFARSPHKPRSEGIRRLRRLVDEARTAPIYARLREELPALVKTIASFRSISIGINLGSGLEPVEATILSVNSERYSGEGLAGRLFSDDPMRGIATLHTSLSDQSAANPALIPLFKDLSDIMQKSVRPLAKKLSQFADLCTHNIVMLGDELLFYAGAVRLARRLQAAGLPVCSPNVTSAPPARFEAECLYNLNLAIARLETASQEDVVTSSVKPGDSRPLWVVTGPNNGGKTTFLHAVGVAQLVAQVGLFAPARHMSLTTVDAVYTHYPALERDGEESGRFVEEARRLRNLLLQITPLSLLLLNESLSGTAMGEAVHLACDLLDFLSEVRCRTVYVTHMHELATSRNSAVASLVAAIRTVNGKITPAYRVEEGVPAGKSYAQALAAQYGLEPEALRQDRQKADPAIR